MPAKSLLALTFLLTLAFSSFAKEHRKPAGEFVSRKNIPAPVEATIETAAAGGKIREVRKVPANGAVIYCAEVKGTDGKWNKVYTTDSGTLMKVEPDKARNNRKHKPLFG
jgi:hypothetical protein